MFFGLGVLFFIALFALFQNEFLNKKSLFLVSLLVFFNFFIFYGQQGKVDKRDYRNSLIEQVILPLFLFALKGLSFVALKKKSEGESLDLVGLILDSQCISSLF